MDGKRPRPVEFAQTVDAVTGDIHHPASYLRADRHPYGRARGHRLKSALQAVGGVHRYAAHGIFPYMLLYLDIEITAVGPPDSEGIVDAGKRLLPGGGTEVEMYVNDRADNLRNVSCNSRHRIIF